MVCRAHAEALISSPRRHRQHSTMSITILENTPAITTRRTGTNVRSHDGVALLAKPSHSGSGRTPFNPPAIRCIAADQLRPHPVQLEIYGDQPGAELVESVREHGVLEPLLVTPRNVIISGHLRHAASLQVKRAVVPIIVVAPADENAAIDLLLNANSQRVKTNEQIARETAFRMKIEQQKARERQATVGAVCKLPAKSPEASGDARAIVAKQMGIGVKKVDQCASVIRKLDQLKNEGNDNEAQALRATLDKSINRAAKKVIVLDLREQYAAVAVARATEQIWQTTTDDTAGADSKADIITRIQDDLVDGMHTWSLEQLLRFENDLLAFRTAWETTNLKEVA